MRRKSSWLEVSDMGHDFRCFFVDIPDDRLYPCNGFANVGRVAVKGRESGTRQAVRGKEESMLFVVSEMNEGDFGAGEDGSANGETSFAHVLFMLFVDYQNVRADASTFFWKIMLAFTHRFVTLISMQKNVPDENAFGLTRITADDVQADMDAEKTETALYNKVYDLLVSIGGAPESYRQSFVYDHMDKTHECAEWRFQGHFGFGGKFRSAKWKVDYYPEDETPKRKELAEQLNKALAELKAEVK